MIKFIVWCIRVLIAWFNVLAVVLLLAGQVYMSLMLIVICYLMHLLTQVIQAIFTGTYDGQV